MEKKPWRRNRGEGTVEKGTVEKNRGKVTVESNQPQNMIKDVTNRGWLLSRIIFTDPFHGCLVDSRVDKKKEIKRTVNILKNFQKLYFFEKFSISTRKQKIVIS